MSWMDWLLRSPQSNPQLQAWLDLPGLEQTTGQPQLPPDLLEGDQFAMFSGLSPELQDFIGNQPTPFLLDPLQYGRLLQVPNTPGYDLGLMGPSEVSGVEGADREELEQQLKDLFGELYDAGLPLEARPGSKTAEALATGDFSELTAEDLISLLQQLIDYRENQSNPQAVAARPNAAIAPQGSWTGPGGSNSYGGGTNYAGPNSSATAPSGPAPVGPPPAGSNTGETFAHYAEQVANNMGSTGWCYKGVSNAVSQATNGEVVLTGGSAYMAADQLAGMPDKFEEVSVSPENLSQLPPGAIVVWGQTDASPHGHISVALGDGREASDHVQSQISSLRGSTNYRVFIPRD